MRVELLLSPDCPNAAAARAVLVTCLTRLGLPTAMRERVGAYPSPTILIDGIDVMTGRLPAPLPRHACRLDVPTESRVSAALRAGATAQTATMDTTADGAGPVRTAGW